MTAPGQGGADEVPFTPARRARIRTPHKGSPAQSAPDSAGEDDLTDVERGRTLALLAALGRIQLRLDVLAREQRDGLASVEARLEQLEDRITAWERPPADPVR